MRTISQGLLAQANASFCRYKIGETFYSLPVAEVQGLLEKSTERIDAEVSVLDEKLGEMKVEMQGLKAALYHRFGQSINLES